MILVNALLIHSVWPSVPDIEVNTTVLIGETVIVPVAFTDPQLPANGIE